MEHRVRILPCRKKQVRGRKAKHKPQSSLGIGFLVGLPEFYPPIPKTKNYARIKHFLWKDCWVLFSADFSIITSGGDVLIFYFLKPIFFHGDVVRDINEKGLHILDASADVALDAFHLFLTRRKPVGLIRGEVIFDDAQRFRRNIPFLHSIKRITAQLDGEVF